MANTWTYDPNVDYMELMKAADAAGNQQLAAIYEQQRNAKIAGEGLSDSYPTTANYSKYLPTSESSQGYRSLTEKIESVGKEPFTYDPETDPSMQAYRKAYLREADRGVRDVMGTYAGMTQGVPSSAAITAASQAGDYYRAQLTDKQPEMEAQAYSRWLNGQQQELSKLQLQQQVYGAMREAENDEYTRQQNAYSNLLQLMTGTGYQPTDAELAQAGMSREQADSIMNYYQQQLAAKTTGSGGSSGGPSGGSSGKIVPMKDRQALLEEYNKSGPDAIAATMAYYQAAGYDWQELAQWLGQYGTYGFNGGYSPIGLGAVLGAGAGMAGAGGRRNEIK